MNSSQMESSSAQRALHEELHQKYNTVLGELSPSSWQKYTSSFQSAHNYKNQLSEYAFWYLYKLCHYYGFLEVLVCLNGEVKFHFGDCFLSSHAAEEEEGLSPQQKREICFLNYEKKTLNSYLQVHAALSASAKKLILPIWRKEIVSFIERYFMFSMPEGLGQRQGAKDSSPKILDCLSYLEQQLRSKVTDIIKDGEPARLLHIKLEDFDNLLQVLGLHASHKLFFNIYERLCFHVGSLASVIAFSHSSCFIVGSVPNLGEERMEFYKALDNVKREYHIKFIIYEKNFYNDNIDILSLAQELHL